MAAQDDLWTAVVAAYPTTALIALTNPENPAATSVDTARGTAAALAAINMWPLYTEAAYDESDDLHVQVGIRGTIAMLYERGGTSNEVAKVEYDAVFNLEGMLGRLRVTGARGRIEPSTNSQVDRSSDTLADGSRPLRWADPGNIPGGILPSRRSSYPDRRRD